jgi:hypothetical protein
MTNDRDPESAVAYLTELWERTGMPPLAPEGPWLAGGACVRAITRETPADLDVRFASAGQLHEWLELANLSHVYNGLGRTIEIGIAHREDVEEPVPTVSLIVAPDSFERTLANVLETHDLTCTQIGFDGTRLWWLPGALEDLDARRLRLNPRMSPRWPSSTRRRIGMYGARGFSCGMFTRMRLAVAAGFSKDTPGPSGT